MIHTDYLGTKFKSGDTVVEVRLKPYMIATGMSLGGKFIEFEQPDLSRYWEVTREFTYDDYINNPYVTREMGNGFKVSFRQFDRFMDDDIMIGNDRTVYCIKDYSDDPEIYYAKYPPVKK